MNFHAIGLMSGTSLDGLDLCYTRFENHGEKWQFEILNTSTFPYSEIWETKLKNAIHLSAEDLLELNSEYGFYLGENVLEFIHQHHIKNCDLIASHGHTVFHQPQRKFTLQIGDGRAIKLKTGIPVVYDFRSQDVLMGGNGAPLVPIGDELLFSEYEACLNLGGFSNISFRKNGKRIAFDICPVNIVLNEFAQKLGKKFDENGAIAKAGSIDEALLEKLNTLSFYKENPPKSLGLEWVKENIYLLFSGMQAEKILATFTRHIAVQIAEVFKKNNLKNVLLTGGGAYNRFLIHQISELSDTEIIIPDSGIIEYKEALIFAFMGVLRMQNRNNVLSSSTGSSADHSSGIIA